MTAWRAFRTTKNERHAAWERSGTKQNERRAAWERFSSFYVPVGAPNEAPQKYAKPLILNCFSQFVDPTHAEEAPRSYQAL